MTKMNKKSAADSNEKFSLHFFSIFIFLAFIFLAFMFWWPIKNLPYYGDATTLVVNGAKSLQARNFQPLTLIEFKVSHPTLLITITGLIWNIFGESLEITHAIMIPFLGLLGWSLYEILQKYTNRYLAILSSFSFIFFPLVLNQFQQITLSLVLASLSVFGAYLWIEKKYVFSMLIIAASCLTSWLGLILIPGYVVDWFLNRREKLTPRLFLLPIGASLIWFMYHGISDGWWFIAPSIDFTGPDSIQVFFNYVLFILRQLLSSPLYWLYFLPGIFLGVWKITMSPKSIKSDFIDIASITSLLGLVLFFGISGNFTLDKSLLILPLMYVTTILSLSNLVDKIFNSELNWAVSIFVASLIFFSLTQWRTDTIGGPGFHFTPDYNLTFQDTIFVNRQVATYLELNYPDAQIIGAFPEAAQLLEPHNGYVKSPLDFIFCDQYIRERQKTQILYIHPYHQSQVPCHELLSNTPQAVPLKDFSYHGKWVELFILKDATVSGNSLNEEK